LSIIVARRRNYFFSWIFLTADHFLPYACFPIRSLSLSLWDHHLLEKVC
jgi:hypothetical protein